MARGLAIAIGLLVVCLPSHGGNRSSLMAAYWVGKEPLFLVTFRKLMCSDSTALLV